MLMNVATLITETLSGTIFPYLIISTSTLKAFRLSAQDTGMHTILIEIFKNFWKTRTHTELVAPKQIVHPNPVRNSIAFAHLVKVPFGFFLHNGVSSVCLK